MQPQRIKVVFITFILAVFVLPTGLIWADGGPEAVPSETPPPLEPTAEATVGVTLEPTVEATAAAEEPTIEATVEATLAATEAAEEPTAEATAEVILDANAELTPEATAETTPEATAEPTVEAAAEAPASEASIAEIVAAAAEADITLAVVDADGEIAPLVTEAAAEALSGGDPYFENPPGSGNWFGYTTTTCPNPPVAPANCTVVVANAVQSAVNAAPDGTTIYIAAGSYTEQVVIVGRNNLTLQGLPGAEIHSPVTLPQFFTVSGNPIRPVVLVNGSSNIVIQNLVIAGDGQGNGDYRFVGVGYNNSSGTIDGNTITGIRETPLSGTQHGVGVYVWNGDGVARTVNITDNVISDYQKNGIAASGNGLTVNIDGNTVTGAGPLGTGLPAQNGIQVSFGATGSVTNNTVTGNYYTNPAWGASGILIYNTSGVVVVADNDVSDNNVGLNVVSNGAGQTAQVDSSGNTFSGNDWGASVASYTNAGTANATFDGETFTGNDVGLYTDNPATTVHNSAFTGNTTAVEHDTAAWGLPGNVDATGNWWGAPGGPYHPTLNPTGIGDEVSDRVDFDPWLTGVPAAAAAPPPSYYLPVPMGRLNPDDGAVHAVYVPPALYDDGIRVFYRDTPERLAHLVPAAPQGYRYAYQPDQRSYFDFFGFRYGWSLGTYREPVTVCFAAADEPGTQVLALYSGTPRTWTILPSFVSSGAAGEPLICAPTAQLGGIALLLAPLAAAE